LIFALPLLLFLLAVFALPVAFILVYAFLQDGTGPLTLAYIERFFVNPIYLRVLSTTLGIGLVATTITLVIGYMLAYFIARQPARLRMWLLLVLLLPFYTSVLVKSFAFSVTLGYGGVVNETLRLFFGPDFALSLLHNTTGVMIGVVNEMLPFMAFPIVVNLLGQDARLRQAAQIMGASHLRIFWQVTFPLSLPAVMAGVVLVVVRCLGQYAVPALLGGRQDMMMSNLVRFHVESVLDWNMAAAISVVLMSISAVFLVLLSRSNRSGRFTASALP